VTNENKNPTSPPQPSPASGEGDKHSVAADVGALLTGLKTTLSEAFRPAVTTMYPEDKTPRSERYRGRHYLRRYDNGLERCIGCELCAAACPANCITVIGAENDPAQPVSPGERYGYRYEIDMLRCIFCGFCEEACPTDAIVLTPRFDIADYTRDRLVFGKDKLLVKDQFTQHLSNTESSTETEPGRVEQVRPAPGSR